MSRNYKVKKYYTVVFIIFLCFTTRSLLALTTLIYKDKDQSRGAHPKNLTIFFPGFLKKSPPHCICSKVSHIYQAALPLSLGKSVKCGGKELF